MGRTAVPFVAHQLASLDSGCGISGGLVPTFEDDGASPSSGHSDEECAKLTQFLHLLAFPLAEKTRLYRLVSIKDQLLFPCEAALNLKVRS